MPKAPPKKPQPEPAQLEQLLWVGGHFKDFQKNGQGYKALCPLHDDTKPSLSINEGEGGRILVNCLAGCPTSSLLEVVGLRMPDLMPNAKPRKEIVELYDYRDETGLLLLQAVRFEPKDFRQRCPNLKGGWIWSTKDVRRVLYRLVELIAADPAEVVFIVEGEKDVERLRSLGFVATCNVGGAGKWRAEYNEFLRGRLVVILVDNDDPGRAHAADVARSLSAIAAAIKIVELPGLSAKGADVSDWIDAGGTADELRQIVDETPVVQPADLRKPNTQVSQVSGSGSNGKREREDEPPPWGAPVYVEEIGDLPTFPVTSLPPDLADWALAVAENGQTPVDLPAMTSLAATGMAIAKRAVIQPYKDSADYWEPANTYSCTPLPSGLRKTFVVNMARSPFDAFHENFLKTKAHDYSLRQQEHRALEKQRDRLTDELAKATKKEERDKKKKELAFCLHEMNSIDLYLPRSFADDVTPERLAVLMSEHGGRIAVFTDEGGCFDHFAGIYNTQPNIDVYLHGHSGGTIRRDRQGNREQVCVKQAALSISVSPQPQVIAGMKHKDRLQGRGLLARFLWSFPKSTLGNRDWEPQAIPDKVKKKYSARIMGLLAWEADKAKTFKLSDAAFKLWITTARGFEVQLRENGSLANPGLQEWASKLPGAIARIALQLHCAAGKSSNLELSAKTMHDAIEIGKYLIPHAMVAFKVLRTDPEQDNAQVLQKWIIGRAEKGHAQFTRSEAYQNHKSRFANSADLNKPLKILVDRQICRPSTEKNTYGPGQPSVFYDINPAIVGKP